VHWQAENLSCACLQAMKKLDFLQLKASFFTNVSKAIIYYKTNKKAKIMLCSVTKHGFGFFIC